MKEIRDWPRHEYEAFETFGKEFANESDRAAVILGAAKLDILLYQILQRYLLPITTNNDELLDGDSPLATFSSRINVCYRIGLIDREVTRSLHLVRRIRNSFAHELSGISLENGSHRDRIKELAAPFRSYVDFDYAFPNLFQERQGAGREFRMVVAILCLRLDGLFEVIEPVNDDAQCLIPPGWKTHEEAKVEKEKAGKSKQE